MNRSLLCLLIAWALPACNATVEAGSDLRDAGDAPSSVRGDADSSTSSSCPSAPTPGGACSVPAGTRCPGFLTCGGVLNMGYNVDVECMGGTWAAVSKDSCGPELDATTTHPDCHFDAATFEVYGAYGNALQDVQGLACSATDTCTEAIAGGPFCGDLGTHLDDYACTCTSGKEACVLVSSGLGISAKGWCDGGDGSNDAGR